MQGSTFRKHGSGSHNMCLKADVTTGSLKDSNTSQLPIGGSDGVYNVRLGLVKIGVNGFILRDDFLVSVLALASQ